MVYDVSSCFDECIRLREYWNFMQCGEYEPMGLTYENRCNMGEYDAGIRATKFRKF